MSDGDAARIETFIARWQGREGGQERANYALFLSELCVALGLTPPDPAGAAQDANDYVFERVVRETARDGSVSHRRIDLYRRGHFVLEAKQSRQNGGGKEVAVQDTLFADEPAVRGKRGAARAWDVLMMNARRQAEDYVRLLPGDHVPPPFVLVCDVGHCIEVYANFRQDGKAYSQFPDRQSYRIYLEELRDPATRARLVAIWSDPASLDPSRRSARVTREVAERLAAVSKALEDDGHPADHVAMFLMRCLFTMFAEDIGLLPEKSFQALLKRCVEDPNKLGPLVGQLWEAMDRGGFAIAIEAQVRQFNGEFFKTRTVLPLRREEIGELCQAAAADWREVDPSIFGTLLEKALDPKERRSLGAHYTPRAYVERLVVATIIEPLRADWEKVLSTAERQKADGRIKAAIKTVGTFHDQLCSIHVLDPACGTGNFLYVTLELLKRLEGEVLEALADLGGQEALSGLESHTVDPHQFLGLEINARAAAIAELVLWIGYLQWHLRTKGGMPADPVLRAFKNIVAQDAVLRADEKLERDERGKPLTVTVNGDERERIAFENPRRPEWPAAEFIVGNPPFIGGKDIRERLGDAYAEALWAAHPKMNDSADFVMYWWDHAAELLTRKGTPLRRFGFVTTNSISQVFQRRVLERHLKAKKRISLVAAIPDHPWTKATRDAAAVRIAMTVAEAGERDGILQDVVSEIGLDTDAPRIELRGVPGTINSDLTVGADVTSAIPLRANEGICSPGVKLHGAGFIITPGEATRLGLGRRPGLERYIKAYRNGRDLTSRPRDVMVIDLFGVAIDEVREKFPEVYQHLTLTVKADRETQYSKSPTKDAESYLQTWWVFGKPRTELRPALAGLQRYIATVETAKHRVFQFLDSSILPDNMLVAIASDDPFHLGVLSSRMHKVWALRAGGWLGMGNDPRYSKSRCFDPFPFPVPPRETYSSIAAIAEKIDSHRKPVLAENPDLTLTGIYNVLEELRAGANPSALDKNSRDTFEKGIVLVLKEMHDELDEAVAKAYGLTASATDEEILAHLVTLNKRRAAEERHGEVRWPRPDYQILLLGTPKDRAALDLAGAATGQDEATTGKPSFPTDEVAQTAAVMAMLSESGIPINAPAIASRFKQGKRVEAKVSSTLAAVARMGFIVQSADGSGFSLRRS